MLALEAEGVLPVIDESPDLYIASMGDTARAKSFEMTEALRSLGKRALFDQVGRSVKAQMKYADKMGAKYSMVLGDSELEGGKAILKNMQNGESCEVEIANISTLAECLR